MADGTSASSKPAGDAKGLGKKLDTDNTTKLDMTKDVQDKPEPEAELVKPDVKFDAMTTNVTIPVTGIQHTPGNMAIITTSAGQLIVPGVAFANGNLPAEIDADSDQEGEVVVTAAYARSQSLV